MPKPLTTKTDADYRPQLQGQPQAKIIDNPPADSLAKALANSKRQIEATK
jgi:hypothetical protein